MKQQTSIHVQPVKGGSEQHNKREKNLDYIRPELSHLNEYWEKDTQANRLETIKENYLKTTHQKMQAKATPIREAVVVIKADTTMDDLQKLADAYRQRFGIDTFQIAIHKDEGYPQAEEWKPNLHAHLVFDWTNKETGKSLKLNRADMVDMQTITAEVLHMDRGISSDKEHLTALQYKNATEQAKIEQIKAELENLSTAKARKEAAIESVSVLSDSVKGLFGQSSKDKEIKALKTQINESEEARKTEKATYNSRLEIIKQQVQKALDDKKREFSALLTNVKQQRDEANQQANTNKAKADISQQVVYSLWADAKDAVQVLCKFLHYKRLNVSFNAEEVNKIEQAIKPAKTIAERETYGKNLVKLAHAEHPEYPDNSPHLTELNNRVGEVARHEWKQQDRSKSRERGEGMSL